MLAACTQPLPAAEYRAYLLDPAHGLTHTQQVNGATVTCTYRPIPLLVMQDLARVSAPTSGHARFPGSRVRRQNLLRPEPLP